jgi:hypothetical protein
MRTFEHPNLDGGWRCPVCKTSADQPVTLVGIPGTEEGDIMRAEQIHAECKMLFDKMIGIEKGEAPTGAPLDLTDDQRDAGRFRHLIATGAFRTSSIDMSGKHTWSTTGRLVGRGTNVREAIDRLMAGES